MTKTSYTLLVSIIAIGIIGCDKSLVPNDSMDDAVKSIPFETTKSQDSFIKANNEFTFDLLRALLENKQYERKDFMLSPLSIGFTLSALSNGAEGLTQKQILDVLGYESNSTSQANEYCKFMLDGCNAVDEKVSLGIHTALVSNKDYALKHAFVESMESYYDAYVKSCDFAEKSSLDMINNWAHKKTNGMIPCVLETLNAETAMILLNCIDFKARWTNEFLLKNTKKEAFTDIDGNTQEIMMMTRLSNETIIDNGSWKVLRLPFGRGYYNMYILLPAEGEHVSSMINKINESSWIATQSSMKQRKVDLKIPKFETVTSISLNDALQSLGICEIFSSESADFSAMAAKGLYVNQFEQKSKIKVDEEGVEAASITNAQLDGVDFPNENEIIEFHANRPFAYLIQESSSNAIFFAGVKCK